MEDKTLPLVPGKMCVIYIKWTNIPFKLRGLRKNLDCKEGWALKNWCFQIVVLEKTLESPLDCKIKPVNPKGNQSWIFIGMTDAEAEAPILWSPDARTWFIGKDPDSGKYWKQAEQGMTEDEIVGWHHWLDGHGFGQALGDGEKQGSLAYCSPWGHSVGHNWVTKTTIYLLTMCEARTNTLYMLILY